MQDARYSLIVLTRPPSGSDVAGLVISARKGLEDSAATLTRVHSRYPNSQWTVMWNYVVSLAHTSILVL